MEKPVATAPLLSPEDWEMWVQLSPEVHKMTLALPDSTPVPALWSMAVFYHWL